MSTAPRADAEQIPLSARRHAVSALVRAPSIPPRRKDSLMTETKRVAVVLRRGMKQSEFRNVEEQLDMHNLTCLPVLAGQRRMTVADTPVCGFIVTGGDMDPSHAERELIMGTVRETLDRDIPVVAMSEAVPLVLEAAGVKGAVAKGRGVLLHRDSIRVLETGRELADAVKLMAKSAAR
jgi:hypothetical protein